MAYLNIEAQKQNTFDAIVIGSGISGGWAAKELCEGGLKTLVLERGRDVKHLQDYPTMHNETWDYKLRGALTYEEQKKHKVFSEVGWAGADSKHFIANDVDNPYTEVKPFVWMRGHQVGGRSMLWGRQTYRWSDLDFEANAKDGHGVDWPIRYKDIEPWYTYVEKFAGISGEALGLPHLPDSHFLPPMELNCVEEHAKQSIEENYDRHLIIGRVAHLTQPLNGRGQCQFRNRCSRGCPYGAYFSSMSVTIPAAEKTGNLTLRPHSIVSSIIYDEKKGKATGVRIVDAETNEEIEFYAKIIFSNASTLSTTSIFLNSTSNRFPNGFGNDSGELGHNLMDHTYKVGAMGGIDGFLDKYYSGRRPNGIYIPRYVNLDEKTKSNDFVRGFGFQGGAGRSGWGSGVNNNEFGADFKDGLMKPGGWGMFLTGFAECLPNHENKVTLNHELKNKWGLSTLSIDAEFKDNELAMNRQIKTDAVEMLEKAGFKDIMPFDAKSPPGHGVHEMGTARMGRDPKTSVLNGTNQVHAAKNVFVTDGACMTSSSCVNPSLTYMAITARAANHAVEELKKQNL
ncbi:choline dehydrogenase-like flavoprotein [Saonia flava]|uniref:Choline dehydrogenase-like flavoprotein n=1 Tax=Saonia flava TaxID=523696 RepID=A0A846QQU0_9FLAO|nr:GMC family oxidoreductase [Saonia flava]NJB70511.1 choline dehydrogenase-like flavoprotein [Saonia flava]